MPTRVTGTIHLTGQHSYIQATIDVDGNAYPDVLREAEATVLRLLADEWGLVLGKSTAKLEPPVVG